MSGASHREEVPGIHPMDRDLSQISHSVMAALTMRADVLTTPYEEMQGEQPVVLQR